MNENRTNKINNLIATINSMLPIGLSAEYKEVIKNNNILLDGICFIDTTTNVSPIIYLNQFEDLLDDETKLAQRIIEIYTSNTGKKFKDFDFSLITSEDWIKSCVKPRLTMDPAPGLLTAPFLDLYITFYVSINENASIQLTNENCKIPVEVLRYHAIKHTKYEFYNMSEVIPLGDPDDYPLWILTNESNLWGAAAILDDLALASIAQKFGTSFYILPSSIHEVIIIPDTYTSDLNTLISIVKDINKRVLDPTEVLSDNIYLYIKDSSNISIVR